MRVPFCLCKSSSDESVGWDVRVMSPVGRTSRSGFIGIVVKVVCVGCQPPNVIATCGGVSRGLFCDVCLRL